MERQKAVRAMRDADNMFLAMQCRPLGYRAGIALRLLLSADLWGNPERRREAREVRAHIKEKMAENRRVLKRVNRHAMKIRLKSLVR